MWQFNTQIISAIDHLVNELDATFIRSSHNSLTLQPTSAGPWTIQVYGIQGVLLSTYPDIYVGDTIPLYLPNGIYVLHAVNQAGERHTALYYYP